MPSFPALEEGEAATAPLSLDSGRKCRLELGSPSCAHEEADGSRMANGEAERRCPSTHVTERPQCPHFSM